MAANYQHEADAFDLKLATECAAAFSQSTGLGCAISDVTGGVFYDTGYSCEQCELCAAVGRDRVGCVRAHTYGMTEAERFGGKYIYFCPMGLTCFVSPIMGQAGSAAKITVGPFLMVDEEDFVFYDLEQRHGLNCEEIEGLASILQEIPYVSPHKVNALSILLFMSVGFMNNVSAANRMLDNQDADMIQGQISAYIMELKSDEHALQYPFETERALLAAITDNDEAQAQKLLNELLGHILFASGGDVGGSKARIYELLVLMSRASVDAGASPDLVFRHTQKFIQQAAESASATDLCFLLARQLKLLVDSVFQFPDVKNADVIQKSVQYMRRNCTQKVTLEEVAEMVHLSPSYFSKIFKKEVGSNFNTYLNCLRIEKSKKMLLHESLKLVDIASMTGFEDQSYFTKVFKRVTGVSPNQYRRSGGRLEAAPHPPVENVIER